VAEENHGEIGEGRHHYGPNGVDDVRPSGEGFAGVSE
jgi:hypothetical protein